MKIPEGLLVYGDPVCWVCGFLWRTHPTKQKERGKIIPKPCQICGSPLSHGHHPNYSKPLNVKWFCRQHHMELHRKPTKAVDPAVVYDRIRALKPDFPSVGQTGVITKKDAEGT